MFAAAVDAWRCARENCRHRFAVWRQRGRVEPLPASIHDAWCLYEGEPARGRLMYLRDLRRPVRTALSRQVDYLAASRLLQLVQPAPSADSRSAARYN